MKTSIMGHLRIFRVTDELERDLSNVGLPPTPSLYSLLKRNWRQLKKTLVEIRNSSPSFEHPGEYRPQLLGNKFGNRI
jgi:hypothetical protein